MTQSVAAKTSIPEKKWRRQTDSPTWWITFTCGSVILHLLAFWLISLYKLNSVQGGVRSSAVAIEFIEISKQQSSKVQPKAGKKPKPVLQQSNSNKIIAPQSSKPIEPPSVPTTDRNAIAFDNQKIERQLAEQQRQQKILQQQQLAEQQRRKLEAKQRQREADQQRLLEAEQRRLVEQLRQRQIQQRKLEAQISQQEQEQQRILAEQLRQQEAEQQRQLEAQRQQEVEQQRQLEAQRQQEVEQQRQLEAQRQQEAEQQRQLEARRQQEVEQQRQLEAQRQQEVEQQRQLEAQRNISNGEKIANGPTDALGRTPEQREQAPQAPIKNQQAQIRGILTASWNIDPEQPKQDIPDNPPQLKNNVAQSFVIKPLQENNFQQPLDFKVYLNINEEGYVQFAQIVDDAIRKKYQEYIDENLLNKQLFLPATDIDPRTGEVNPRRGELYIRIKIQQSS